MAIEFDNFPASGSAAGALLIANNLSDLNNATTARTNLGLGTASTQDTGTTANDVVQLNASAQLPAVDGSLLTNITATDSTKLAIANNLSDLNNATTARTNLGLGTASTQDVGTTANDVVQLNASAQLPAVDGSLLTNITATDSTKLAIANNLSDLNNATTARTNLGLGTAATQDVGTTANDVVQLNASAQLPAVDGSLLTNITATDSTKLAIANNLSDLNNATTARTNLGLGTASTQDVGTTANDVVQLNASAQLPAVDGSLLTNITATDSTKLAIANNLSDLNNATTARTNLGLGTAATQDVGTTANDVVQLNASAQLPAVDGSLLTNITATDSTKLAIANNLSDLNNVATARTNLGLGTASTQDVGTTANDVVQLNASAQLPAVDGSLLTNITATDSTKLAIANNLSDLNNVATARTNLGLGTASTQDVGTTANDVVQLNASAQLPAVDGSLLTNITATDSTKLAIANNLSDLNNVATARTNLGLGTASTQDVGTTANDVVQLNASAQLPAVDGSLLTNITATDSTKLAIANNLSDLNNVATARTNLGLGTASTQDVGTSANNVVQLDGTAKLPAVDGSQLTNITATDSTKLAIANNLSDLNNATTARTNLGLGTASTQDVGTSANNVVQLNASANIDLSSNDIVSTSNNNIELAPDGSGKVKIKGNATGGSGQIVLNCEQNTHGITLKGPPHSAAATYTLTLPNNTGNNADVLQSDGNGNLSWTAQTGGGGGGFTYQSITVASSPVSAAASYHYSADTSGGAITVNLPALSGVTAGTEIRFKLKTAGNNLTLDGNSTETIDGNPTYVLNVQNQAVTCVSDGSGNWEII